MKFISLIATLMASTTLIQDALVEESSDEERGGAQCSGYYVVHARNDQYPDTRVLMRGDEILETVYFDTIIRSEEDHNVCMTDNPLSHALVPNTPETRQEWCSVASFLFEFTAAGLEYANNLRDTYTETELPKTRATNAKFLLKMTSLACYICLELNSIGYISEAKLNTLYQHILSAIDEIEQDENQLSKPLIDIMYLPVRDWMKTRLPINSMYEYVQAKATMGAGAGALKRIDYFLQPEKYFQQYFQRTPECVQIN